MLVSGIASKPPFMVHAVQIILFDQYASAIMRIIVNYYCYSRYPMMVRLCHTIMMRINMKYQVVPNLQPAGPLLMSAK